MKLKLSSIFLSLGLFATSSLSAEADLERMNAQIENNSQLARQITQFNVSNHLDLVADIVSFLSENNPELTCNICIGAIEAFDEPDEETIRAIMEAGFAAHPQLAQQVGECVAGVHEEWEPLISSMLAEMGDLPVDEETRVLPPQEPLDRDLPPDTVTPIDATVPSPN
ncbi:MAG: hypothetical protein LAT55_08120 [Opitutales bacterium]|nr:hypothetical protein [Opitutales bacterium]